MPGPTARPNEAREYALLLFLYNTGARVSEAKQLKVRDLQIGRGSGGYDLVTLHGKGGRRANARFGRKLNAFWPIRSSVAPPMTLLRQQARKAVYPLRGLSAHRTLRGSRAGTGRQNDNAACDPSHDGLPPGARRRRHQYRPRLAWPCLDQHHQHLCRDRPHPESSGSGPLRGRSATAGSIMEGGQESHGLSEILVSQEVCCGVLRRELLL